MNRFLIVFILVGLSINMSAQKFPELNGKTLEDQIVTLPIDAEGKFTLVGLSYNKKAEEYLRSWYDPIFNL